MVKIHINIKKFWLTLGAIFTIASVALGYFLNFAPLPKFLSDVAAFEAVVIAIAVPLSLEIVSRISERYHSGIVTNRFVQEIEIKLLPAFLLANIIVAVSLRFFVNNVPTSLIWKILAWFVFFGFLFIGLVLFRFFILLKRYTADIEYIEKTLFDDAEKLLK